MGMHLIGVQLLGVHFLGMHFMAVHLIGVSVHFMGKYLRGMYGGRYQKFSPLGPELPPIRPLVEGCLGVDDGYLRGLAGLPEAPNEASDCLFGA